MAGLSPAAALSLLKSGEFSDLTIRCQNREFRVHKAILCPQSSFFRTMCLSSFKEGVESRCNLLDDDPDIVGRVLLYLYTNDYDTKAPLADSLPGACATPSTSQASATDSVATEARPTGELSDTSSKNLAAELHTLVYACADKLGIASLKQTACRKFMAAFTAEELTAPTFASVLTSVFENTAATDDVLRAAVVQRLFKEMVVPRNVPEIEKVLRRYEPIAWAVFEAFEQELAKRAKEYKSCRESLFSTELKYKALLGEKRTLQATLQTFETDAKEKDKRIKSLKKFVNSTKKPFCSACGNHLNKEQYGARKQLYLQCPQCLHLQYI